MTGPWPARLAAVVGGALGLLAGLMVLGNLTSSWPPGPAGQAIAVAPDAAHSGYQAVSNDRDTGAYDADDYGQNQFHSPSEESAFSSDIYGPVPPETDGAPATRRDVQNTTTSSPMLANVSLPASDLTRAEPESVLHQDSPFAAPPARSRQSLPKALIAARQNGASPLRGAMPPGKTHDEMAVVAYYSWMCQLLPYLGHKRIYHAFDLNESWVEPHNMKPAMESIPEFLNPADDRTHWEGYPYEGAGLTHFVGMSGVEDRRTEFAATLPRSDPRAGIFGYDEVMRPEEVTDGLSQTIMIAGAGEVIGPWVAGGGATVRGARKPYLDPITGLGTKGLHPRGVMATFADGATRQLSADIDPRVFRALCTAHGNDSVDVEALGAPVR